MRTERRHRSPAGWNSPEGAPPRSGRQVDFAPFHDFGLLSIGETRVDGLLEGDDVLRTAEACQALGATITREAPAAGASSASASAG